MSLTRGRGVLTTWRSAAAAAVGWRHPGLVTAALATVIVGASCSSAKNAVPVSSATTVRPTSTTVAPPASNDELASRLVTVTPSGFVVQPDQVGDTGPSDLPKAARDDGAPGAAQALRSEGFVRGYQRLWTGSADAEIILVVYQFETPAGAAADFQRAKPELTKLVTTGVAPFTVEGLPPSQAAAIAGTSQGVSAAAVLFTTGVFVVEVTCNGPILTGLQERASTIAREQYGRL